MNKKLIYAFLGIVGLIIIAVVVVDLLSSRPEKRGENPFSLNVDEYRVVDPELILYNEIKNMRLQPGTYRGIHVSGDSIFVLADNFLQIVDTSGRELRKFDLPDSPRAVNVSGETIFVAYRNYVSAYSREGDFYKDFPPLGDSAVLTSLAAVDIYIFAADAGNRQVHRYTRDGELLGSFQGKREADDLHGFIIPSPNFDLVNNFDDLWVVNPGMHALENYSIDGDLRGYWENLSMTIDGFSGCCNPAHIAALPNGYFVTSEKGIVRIKVYEQSGKFRGVVAAPLKFDEDGKAPDIAVSKEGLIYALDLDRKLIRVFEEKKI